MDEETVKEDLKKLNSRQREILYYRCPDNLKPIEEIREIMALSTSSVNNGIRQCKDVLGVEEFGEDICRILIQEYGEPPYSEQPPEPPPPPPDPPPPPTSGRNWLQDAVSSFRGPRAIGVALLFGLAGLISIVVVCFIAYALLQVDKGKWPPTSEPTSVVEVTDTPVSKVEQTDVPETGIEPTSDIAAIQTQTAGEVIANLTREAPPPTNTPSGPPPTPRPTNTPRATNTPEPTKEYYDEGESLEIEPGVVMVLGHNFGNPGYVFCPLIRTPSSAWHSLIFDVFNRTDRQFLARFDPESVHVVDNLGNTYPFESSGVYRCTSEPGLRSGTINANDSDKIMLAIIGEFGIDAQYLTITFDNISGNGPFVFRKDI